MECISGYKIPVLDTLHQLDPPLEPARSKEVFGDTQDGINRLLSLGTVETYLPVSGQFLFKYPLVNKSEGSERFILNLKEFSNFLCT